MARFDKAVGRRVYPGIDGVERRLYYEERGSGVPVLCQHTAEADGRQRYHFVEHERLTQNCRMISSGLPYHAKSLPPTEKKWGNEEYKLCKDSLMQIPISLSKSLDTDRPINIGTSIGEHLAADLALHCPDEFRAVIGLEAALYTPCGRRDVWNNPKVSSAFKSMSMYGLMAPTGPEKYRREIVWVYSQVAPPVFIGDLYYYSVDHDLQETVQQTDTSKVSIYLLTGEFDWASTAEQPEELAARIKGTKYQMMQGLGHFPMSEDPECCHQIVEAILNEVREPRL